MQAGKLKQILLITDGCSNQGEDPTLVASLIKEQGITVNVIGVLDHGDEDSESLQEVEEIAESGGGVSQIVYPQRLTQTVQAVTKQAMTQTLQGVVNQELRSILGDTQSIESLPPSQRGEVMEVVEELTETCDIQLLVLVDTSASMQKKIELVKEALIDLSISMNARIGDNKFSIYSFPGKKKATTQILDWSTKLDKLASVFPKLTSGGVTPTGPALKEALHHYGQAGLLRSLKRHAESEQADFGI
ncbi:Ca-activated chloride channel family protein [Amphibacillus marinus]|uniref:Ca-activated chloride channel family protein n=1 Tax=Amphibacillus marinus TaxID=872970 RepID=A0A1H8TKQ3_9BACI|nr:VWA domain-containing protein [Amphibacillus marinus]SEO91437.1 Ca-activated chloride channel family protein [Amphibacillus marinus]